MAKKGNLYSTNLIYAETGILDPRQIFFIKVGIFYFKNKKLFGEIRHEYSTRERLRGNLSVPASSKSIGQRHHMFLAPRVINFLPVDLRGSSSLAKFKSDLRKYVLSRDRMEVHRVLCMARWDRLSATSFIFWRALLIQAEHFDFGDVAGCGIHHFVVGWGYFFFSFCFVCFLVVFWFFVASLFPVTL